MVELNCANFETVKQLYHTAPKRYEAMPRA